jgi:diacylglycerol kinase
MQKQNGVLVDVLKQLTVNFMQGLAITHISMPVRIFEARTSIERICDLFSQATHFLKKAAETADHYERFKLVITYALSSIYLICG